MKKKKKNLWGRDVDLLDEFVVLQRLVEYGTYKTVKAIFWPCRSGESP
jgi:hypothetical protein